MKELILYQVSILCACLLIVKGQTDLDTLNRKCDHVNAISLPKDKKCLVPIKTATTWTEASRYCELAGGSLYETPDARPESRPELMRCLSAMSDSKYDDMWINAVGLWYPHFFWINGTLLNKVDFCSILQPPREDNNPIASNTLSVDYCVSTCHDQGARYIVLYRSNSNPECYCRQELPQKYQQPCYTESVDFSNPNAFFIVHSKEDSLISVSGADAFTSTEILCATVDSKTLVQRQMQSDTCFTKNPFICCLGEANRCVDTNCVGPVCRFIMRDKCMLRVSLEYSWYAARAYCVGLGGDLWNMHEFNEMAQVNQFLVAGYSYWIGATNYGWTFNGTGSNFTGLPFSDGRRVRCGHMFRERNTALGSLWQWSDTECLQQKSFLCQFNKTDFKQEELELEVLCPWNVPVDTTSTALSTVVTPTIPVVNSNSTGNFTPIATEEYSAAYDGESFPIAAIIAAIIASIILLTCIGLAFTWCSRSHWMAGRFKRVRERLAFIPYFADIPVADFEVHGISSVSDHGSQTGLIKGDNHASGYAMSSSYAEQSGMFSSSKTMERGQGLARNQNFLASGNSSAEERGFAAANASMSSGAREFMTLQAQMNILDDADVAALRESLRRKPEVTVVTDNVDLNFTVNHAVSQNGVHIGNDLSRSTMERTVEEMIMPAHDGGITQSLPERVIEEGRIYSTMTSSYNV